MCQIIPYLILWLLKKKIICMNMHHFHTDNILFFLNLKNIHIWLWIRKITSVTDIIK